MTIHVNDLIVLFAGGGVKQQSSGARSALPRGICPLPALPGRP